MLRRSLLCGLCLIPSVTFAFTVPKDFLPSDSFDVVVVGAGAAGLSAAVEAADAGRSVIVLEKAAEIGGNTLISGGFYSSVDPKRQKAQGIEDSEELFFEQTYENGGEQGDKKLIRHLVENAQDSLEWLEKLGMHFQKNVFELYGSHWTRSHFPVLPLGQGYIRVLSSAALKKGVVIRTSAQMTKLVTEGNQVTGVVANIKGAVKIIKARKGVVIASGSFASNPDLVARFSPKLSGLTTNNIPETTGEAMMAAADVGAALVGMNYIQCLPGCLPGKKYRVRFHNDVSSFIFVDQKGNRFIREDARRDDLRDAILSLPEKYGFILIDSQGFRKAGILVQKEAVLALEGGEACQFSRGTCSQASYEPSDTQRDDRPL
jgi:flavocytochrome c